MNLKIIFSAAGFLVTVVVIIILVVFLHSPDKSTTGSQTTSTITTQLSTSKTPSTTQVLSKLIVATGTDDDAGGILTVEVIDLMNDKTTCQNLRDYPEETFGASGGLDQSNIVHLYGGLLHSPDNRVLANGRWVQKNLFLTHRYYFSSVKISISNAQLTGASNMVTGGIDSGFNVLKSAEILTASGWLLVTDMPNPVYFHCGVALNATRVMVIAGRRSRQGTDARSNMTWIYDVTKDVWSRGIDYVKAAEYPSCGMVIRNKLSLSKSVIVVGGEGNTSPSYDSGTYILHEDATAWVRGPQLPKIILKSVVVEDAWGGVLVVGGHDGSMKPLSTIYRLATSEDQWVLLTQALKYPRWKHAAFLIPDEFASCK